MTIMAHSRVRLLRPSTQAVRLVVPVQPTPMALDVAHVPRPSILRPANLASAESPKIRMALATSRLSTLALVHLFTHGVPQQRRDDARNRVVAGSG